MNISKSFKLYDFTKNETAIRLGIDNTPSSLVISNLKLLAKHILQPLQDDIGYPICIISGFRCIELNRELKSKDNSQHILGQAVDIEISRYNNLKLAEYIRDHYKFDQLKLEFWETDEDDNSGWVHVSYTLAANRNQCLTINKNGVFNGLGEY